MLSPTSSDGHSPPTTKPRNTFADSQFSIPHSEDQSPERLRHCGETLSRGPAGMISGFSELDNSVFSNQMSGTKDQRLRDIPDDSSFFKVPPLPKVTLSRLSEMSYKDQTLDLSAKDGNGECSVNDRSSPNNRASPKDDNTFDIYEKTFSSSFIGSQQPHYHTTINESAFESTHILEHNGSSEISPDRRQSSQYEVDRLRSRLAAMEKLHTMMKNEVEIYRKVADQNKAQSDSPLLQHLEELRQTRNHLEKELAEKQNEFESGKFRH